MPYHSGVWKENSTHINQKNLSQKIKTSSLKLIQDKKIINHIDSSGCGNYHLMLVKGLKKIKNLDLKSEVL